MMLPSIFGENLFDDWMDDFPMKGFFDQEHNPLYGKHGKNLMKTDVKENDKSYDLIVDLPGFKKDEIQVQLENGYLTISASKGVNKDEKDKDGKIVRKERYTGAVERSFYVGDNITEDDVHAKFEDGMLLITLPDPEQKKPIENKKTIMIEG